MSTERELREQRDQARRPRRRIGSRYNEDQIRAVRKYQATTRSEHVSLFSEADVPELIIADGAQYKYIPFLESGCDHESAYFILGQVGAGTIGVAGETTEQIYRRMLRRTGGTTEDREY